MLPENIEAQTISHKEDMDLASHLDRRLLLGCSRKLSYGSQ